MVDWLWLLGPRGAEPAANGNDSIRTPDFPLPQDWQDMRKYWHHNLRNKLRFLTNRPARSGSCLSSFAKLYLLV